MHVSHTQIYSIEIITEELATRYVQLYIDIYIYIHMVKDFLLYSQSVNILENNQQKSLWTLLNGDYVSCGSREVFKLTLETQRSEEA